MTSENGDVSDDIHDLNRKMDVVITRLDFFVEAQRENARRIDRIENDIRPIKSFVDNCELGRKVLLWALSGFGVVAALAMGLYDRIFK